METTLSSSNPILKDNDFYYYLLIITKQYHFHIFAFLIFWKIRQQILHYENLLLLIFNYYYTAIRSNILFWFNAQKEERYSKIYSDSFCFENITFATFFLRINMKSSKCNVYFQNSFYSTISWQIYSLYLKKYSKLIFLVK